MRSHTELPNYGCQVAVDQQILRKDPLLSARVDWVGTTIPIHDPRGGPVRQAHLFVAVLGASSYIYAEATPRRIWDSTL